MYVLLYPRLVYCIAAVLHALGKGNEYTVFVSLVILGWGKKGGLGWTEVGRWWELVLGVVLG